MPIPAYLVGAVMFIALVIYMLTGGADFGGGVWDLFAFGPRKEAQREVIASAIAPIWEANHVWLIIVIVLMFVCFPTAFALMTTALHIPITIMLFGIVLRGSAFVFRTYDKGSEKAERRWGLLFAIGSIITPIMLGVILGSLCSGNIASGFIAPWLQLFPFSVGLFALVLCAFLAATYMIFETHNIALRSDFRKRAWLSGLLVLPSALLCLLAAKNGAPQIYDRLTASPLEIRFIQFTMGVGFFATGALYFAWDQSARALAMLLVVCILSGWVFAQFPYIIVPDHTIAQAAAPSSVIVSVLWALGIGALALVPSFFYLYRIFKARSAS